MTFARHESEPVVGNGRARTAQPELREPLSTRAKDDGGAKRVVTAATPDASGARASSVSTSTRLTGFEGLRLELHRTQSGRYALDVDVELTVDQTKRGSPEAEAEALDGEEVFAAEHEEEDELFAGEDDVDDALALDEDFALEDYGDGEGERELATVGEEEESEPGARWPNRYPVMDGILEISQAPALFDEEEAEEEEERLATEGLPSLEEAAAARLTRAAAVKKMLAAARKTIGLGERPAGSNHNKVTVWYNKHIARIGNGPWCNMAVTYWAGLSSNLAAIFAGKKIGYAYTVAHAQKFRKKKRWRTGVAGIEPGDIVFFDWKGSRSIRNIDHVGVVERVKGKRIITIEGNTSNRCKRMVRNSKYIVGYGRPAYGK